MIAHFLVGQWFPTFVNVTLQSLVLLIAAAITLGLARRASATLRHMLLCAALFAVLLLPLCALLAMPGRPLPSFEQPLNAQAINRNSPSVVNPKVARSSDSLSAPTKPMTAINTGILSSSNLVSAPTNVVQSGPSLTQWAGPLCALWIAGSVFLLIRMLTRWLALRRFASRCTVLTDQSLAARIVDLRRADPTHRPMTVLLARSEDPVVAPMTWGLWRPVLLLPADAAEWPAERLRVAVQHELAHIKRGDWLMQTIGQVACSLYWYNPLAWWLHNRAQIEAEIACDDVVLLGGVAGTDYAAHLLAVVRKIQTQHELLPAAVSMARASYISGRIHSILDARLSRRITRRSSLVITLATMAALLIAITFLRPLARQSLAVAQSVTPATVNTHGSVVTLSGGVNVELVGVAPTEYTENWWSPTGQPLAEAPGYGNNRFHRIYIGIGTQYRSRALLFRLTSPTTNTASTTGYVVDPTSSLQTDGYHHGRDLRLEDTQLQAGQPALGTVLLGFPHTQSHCTYRFGIATGPWQTIAVTKIKSHPTQAMIRPAPPHTNYGPILSLDAKPCFVWTDRNNREHVEALLGGNPPLGDVARRVVALDAAGQEMPLDSGSFTYNGERSIEVSVQTMARIAEVRLQTRPYAWAEFRDIVLDDPRPLQHTVAIPPALPDYHRTYSCGLTVTLYALAEGRKDGGLWWKPDGTPLAGPIKGQENKVQFEGWPANEHPRTLLFQMAVTRPLSVSTALQFIPDSRPGNRHLNWEYQLTPAWNSNSGFTLNESFPAGATVCTLRYGVAAGAWQTAGTVTLPHDVKAINTKPDSFDGDVSLYLADRPRLSYTDLQGKKQSIDFLHANGRLANVARRFIGIDKSGKEVKLAVVASGQDFDVISLTYRDIGTLHSNNPIDLSRIREFRLQTRPYEWAEFRNIAIKPKPQLAQR